MPETKPDKRFESHTSFMIIGLAIAALVGAAVCFAAVERHSTSLWVVLGVLTAGIALAGIGYSAWIFRCYRCPQCHSRLRPERGNRTTPLRIRYHCEQCDTIWDSGITWGGE